METRMLCEYAQPCFFLSLEFLMSRIATTSIDLAAILLLTFGLYFPRYRRKDMVLAYLGLNVGVMAVAVALTINASIGTNFGLGLFGVLSIIRLRSEELAHQEVAYYFASLALGLLGGIRLGEKWPTIYLPAAILVVMFLGDHPRLMGRHRRQLVTLGHAVPNEGELKLQLEELLGGKVQHLLVLQLDMVYDKTVVDVRYRLN